MAEQDFLSSLRELVKSELIDVNTSLNGEIVFYVDGFATVKPLANKQFKDGDSQPFPLIYKVPVRWPSFNGGQCGFKAPIKAGDKVLIIISQQADDGSDDLRRFDLTDAYCIPADNKVIAGGSNNEDTIMYFGDASIRITAEGKIILTAPAGIEYEAPSNAYSGTQNVTGLITGNGGLTAQGGGGVNITGAIINNGKNIGSTHTHGGVQTGGGTTGVVS